jgi:hypothetical protein
MLADLRRLTGTIRRFHLSPNSLIGPRQVLLRPLISWIGWTFGDFGPSSPHEGLGEAIVDVATCVHSLNTHSPLMHSNS